MKRSELHAGQHYLTSRDTDWNYHPSARYDRVLVVTLDPYRPSAPGRRWGHQIARPVSIDLPDGQHLDGTVDGSPDSRAQGVLVLRVHPDTGLALDGPLVFDIVPLSQLKATWEEGLALYENHVAAVAARRQLAQEHDELAERQRIQLQERIAALLPDVSATLYATRGHDARVSISVDTLDRLVALAAKA